MRYDLLVFDIDGTITRHVSSWQFLHEKLGQWDDNAIRYQNLFLTGKISYRRFCKLDAAHWKGLNAERLTGLFQEIPYAKNAARAVHILKENGYTLAAISTGIQFIVDRIKKELAFDYTIGNRLKVRKGKLTGGVTINVSHLGKGRILREVMQRFHVPPSKSIVIGDSVGDLPMMKMAGYAIAFNTSSSALREAADYCCRSDDFMEVCDKILEVSGMTSKND
ncbi:MAG: HAD family phosphatase [Candidatus Aminicenantes bacterium]|nr:HAD family phosphatase [Candidatus Aminicenantes bacterium]